MRDSSVLDGYISENKQLLARCGALNLEKIELLKANLELKDKVRRLEERVRTLTAKEPTE